MVVVELHLILALILLSGMQKTYSGVDALLFCAICLRLLEVFHINAK